MKQPDIVLQHEEQPDIVLTPDNVLSPDHALSPFPSQVLPSMNTLN